jgi:hypothetical protein
MSSGKVITTRMSAGDTRYLSCAGRLAILATKLPPPRLAEFIAEEDEEEETAVGEVNPQKGDCSASVREQAPTAAEPTADVVATSSGADGSAVDPVTAWKALQQLESPVQLPILQAERSIATGRPLRPADRKARKRLLERKLKQSRMAG